MQRVGQATSSLASASVEHWQNGRFGGSNSRNRSAEASLRALLNERSTPQRRVLAAIDPRPLVHLRRGGSN